MILELISTILLGLALIYFICQSIYYYNKINKLEKRILVLEMNQYEGWLNKYLIEIKDNKYTITKLDEKNSTPNTTE